MISPIDVNAFSQSVKSGYTNEVLTTVNDHSVHVSVMDAPFRWHFHPNTDETFIGLEGVLVIELTEGPIRLAAGQMVTIPAGERHRTRPEGSRSVNLTVERTLNKTVWCEGPA